MTNRSSDTGSPAHDCKTGRCDIEHSGNCGSSIGSHDLLDSHWASSTSSRVQFQLALRHAFRHSRAKRLAALQRTWDDNRASLQASTRSDSNLVHVSEPDEGTYCLAGRGELRSLTCSLFLSGQSLDDKNSL